MSIEQKLKSFLAKNGISYSTSKQSFVSDCINSSCKKEDHFYIRKNDGRSICFKCGSKYDWRGLVSIIAHVSREEAFGVLFGGISGEIIGKQLDIKLSMKPEELMGSKPESKSFILGPDFVPYHKSPEALRYLAERGVTDTAKCSQFDIRYHGAMNAVVFPVKKAYGVYGWQARRINPKEKKFRMVTMPGFDKSNFLLNFDFAKKQKKMILVEGPFDCIHADIEGFGAVASLGKLISYEQIQLILKSEVDEIYIGLDNDAAELVYEVVDKLSLRKKVFRIKPPEHRKDFGECTPEEVKESTEKAMSTTAMFLEVYFKELR